MAAGLHNYSVVQAGNASLGQAGSILVTASGAITAIGGAFVAIQFLEDTVFDSTDGLIAETEQLFLDDTGTSTLISASGGAAIDSIVFPQGMTIYGRWTGFDLTSGKVIAYLG